MRAKHNKISVPMDIKANKEKFEMHSHLVKLANKGADDIAGRKCRVDTTKGPKDCLVELVDIPNNEVVLFDFEKHEMFCLPTWEVYHFEGRSNR